MTLSEIEITR